MLRSTPSRRKPAAAYHHGDLRRRAPRGDGATIRKEGIDAVTLRAVGQRLGVSRTALYRHFADKPALLAAVAGRLPGVLEDLREAWTRAGGGGRDGFRSHGRGLREVRDRAKPIALSSDVRRVQGSVRARCRIGFRRCRRRFQVLLDAVVMLQKGRPAARRPRRTRWPNYI